MAAQVEDLRLQAVLENMISLITSIWFLKKMGDLSKFIVTRNSIDIKLFKLSTLDLTNA